MRSNWFGSLEWGIIDVLRAVGWDFDTGSGTLSLTLPHTPPVKEVYRSVGVSRKAFSLLRDPNYRVFFIIALIIATELPLYYILTFPFLQAAGGVVGITSETNLPLIMDDWSLRAPKFSPSR
jgi:hypothetical protein